MGEDAVQAAEDVDEVLHGHVLVVGVGEGNQAAGEDLLVRHDVGGPVERVAAVINGAAALGLLVDGAQELPLRGAHLGARGRAARRGVEEEADDQVVALGDEEAAELIEPEGAVGAWRGSSELDGGGAGDGLGAAFAVVVVERSKVLLQLERGIELFGEC